MFQIKMKQKWGVLLRLLHKYFRVNTGRGFKEKDHKYCVDAYDFMSMRFHGAPPPLQPISRYVRTVTVQFEPLPFF